MPEVGRFLGIVVTMYYDEPSLPASITAADRPVGVTTWTTT